MRKSILIVDDAAFMRMMIKNIVAKHGFIEVEEAKNGNEAIEKYKKHSPDIVTMDITMPDVDGLTAVEGIRSFDPDARIIMCSAMGQQALVMKAIQAGAKDFVVKPFQEERVMESILKHIKK